MNGVKPWSLISADYYTISRCCWQQLPNFIHLSVINIIHFQWPVNGVKSWSVISTNYHSISRCCWPRLPGFHPLNGGRKLRLPTKLSDLQNVTFRTSRSPKKIKPFFTCLRKEGLLLFLEPWGTLDKMFRSHRAGNLMPDLKWNVEKNQWLIWHRKMGRKTKYYGLRAKALRVGLDRIYRINTDSFGR